MSDVRHSSSRRLESLNGHAVRTCPAIHGVLVRWSLVVCVVVYQWLNGQIVASEVMGKE